MKTLLLTLMLAAPVEPTPEAQSLYQEGTTMFDSADYNGAIEKFTAALNLVGNADADTHTRLMLLFNIASAHERQYEIDEDRAHLRQALTLYERYREFAQTRGDLGEELDIEARISRIRGLLKDSDESDPVPEGPEAAATPDPVGTGAHGNWKKPRNTGIGLVIGGGAVTLGGAVLAIIGTQLEPNAQSQVDELADMGVPMDHPAWVEGQQFVEDERRKGRAMIGAGVAVSVVGLVGVGVGSYYLVKAKKLKEGRLSVTPTVSRGSAGIQIGGRF